MYLLILFSPSMLHNWMKHPSATDSFIPISQFLDVYPHSSSPLILMMHASSQYYIIYICLSVIFLLSQCPSLSNVSFSLSPPKPQTPMPLYQLLLTTCSTTLTLSSYPLIQLPKKPCQDITKQPTL
jgi:hypothetical protein